MSAKITSLSGTEINDILLKVDWETWIYEPTLAPVELNFETPESNEATSLALQYIALNGTDSPPGYDAYLNYTSNLKLIFQDTLAANIDSLNL